MAFSIRNLFGNDKPSDTASVASSSTNSTVAEAKNTNGHNPFNSAATNGHAFGGNMLFKTATPVQQAAGQPVSSPFKPASAQPTGLTVGDILPQLPAEALRNISIPTNQPLQLAEEVLEHALRSGQAMLPIFEIYRVCPALFQFPISPQDPRMIPLPTHKLAQISQLLQGKTLSTPPAEQAPAVSNVPSQPHSPFGNLSQTSPAQVNSQPFTPFGASAQQLAADYLPSPHGTTLPQKKTPFGPVSKTEQPTVPASALTTGLQPFAPVPKPQAEAAPTTPFAPAPPAVGRPQGILSSPFAALQSEEDAPLEPFHPPVTPSPFGFGQPAALESLPHEKKLAPSPFVDTLPTAPSVPQHPEPVSANPFARIQALARKEAPTQAPAAPPVAEIQASTFEKPIFAPEPVPAATPFSAAIPTAAVEESLKMSLATLLENCSARDLGIGPELIPSWVQTSLPLAGLRKQFASGRVFVTLRELAEGLSPEFRSLLGAANPDFKVELPVNEVFHALLAPAHAEEQIVEAPSLEAFPSVATHSDFKASEPAANPNLSVEENPHNDWAPAFPEVSPPVETPQNEVLESFPLSAAPLVSAALPARSAANVISRPSQNQRSSSGQLLWRVLLGARENLDAEGVIKLTHSQLGVSAAVCLKDGNVLFASGTGSPEANRFIQQAAQICQHLQPLIELTGIQDTETFSIKNDHYVLTFSIQENVTLAVMHEPLPEEQSMKEKITLIARELAGMLPEDR